MITLQDVKEYESKSSSAFTGEDFLKEEINEEIDLNEIAQSSVISDLTHPGGSSGKYTLEELNNNYIQEWFDENIESSVQSKYSSELKDIQRKLHSKSIELSDNLWDTVKQELLNRSDVNHSNSNPVEPVQEALDELDYSRREIEDLVKDCSEKI